MSEVRQQNKRGRVVKSAVQKLFDHVTAENERGQIMRYSMASLLTLVLVLVLAFMPTGSLARRTTLPPGSTNLPPEPSSLPDESGCSDVLAHGIFNSTVIEQSASSRQSFTEWQCTSDFATHDEAIDAGVSIGVPIYGVPLKLGGSFSREERDTWKHDHCSNTLSTADYAAKYVLIKKLVAPEILTAWQACMEIAQQYRPVVCNAKAPDNAHITYTARWKRAGDLDTVNPVVTSSFVDGATVTGPQPPTQNRLLSQDTRLTSDGVQVTLLRNGNSAVQMSLNTTRGPCEAYIPEAKLSIKLAYTINATGERPEIVPQPVHFDKGADPEDCDRTVTGTERYCVPGAESIRDWTYPVETSGNGPRNVSNIRRDPGNASCVLLDWSIKGLGHDWLGFCSGRGWMVFDMTVNGTRWVKETLPTLSIPQQNFGNQTSFVIQYPLGNIPPGDRNIRFTYIVNIVKSFGSNAVKIDLSDANPNGSGITTSMTPDGRLVVNVTETVNNPMLGFH